MSRRFYSSLTEPNMRQEMFNTLNGAFPEVAKKQRAVYRKMDLSKPCPCVSPLTKESDKDKYCPVCLGESYIWQETFFDIYKVVIRSSVGLATKETLFQPGNSNILMVSFYTTYDLSPNLVSSGTSPDKIVELYLDVEGDPVRPYKRKHIYRIGTSIDFRSDHGKLEYWKLDCYEEQVKFLNGPEG